MAPKQIAPEQLHVTEAAQIFLQVLENEGAVLLLVEHDDVWLNLDGVTNWGNWTPDTVAMVFFGLLDQLRQILIDRRHAALRQLLQVHQEYKH